MLHGLLVDLIPHGETYYKHRRAWTNGPMAEWWGLDGLQSQASYDRWVESLRANDGERDRGVLFGLQAKDGTPIGTFGLFQIAAAHRTAEVGAGIGDPAYWGGGFGSDAMLLIVEYAFTWLDMRRLWLTTMGTNVRAQRQVEKCGFMREGARRSCVRTARGEYTDFLYYGMLREEWPGREVMVERLGLRAKAIAQGYLPGV